MPVARRRTSALPIDAHPSESPRGVMAVASFVEALGDTATDAPAVLVRLLLLGRDEVTGEELLVGSFLKQVSMPPDLIGPGIDIALELFGERRVFKPAGIFWDEPNRVCVVEVEWRVADAAGIVAR